MGLKDPLHIPLTHLNIRGMVLLQINLLEGLETALKFVLRSQSLYMRSQSLYACGARAYMRGARAYMVLKPIIVFALVQKPGPRPR